MSGKKGGKDLLGGLDMGSGDHEARSHEGRDGMVSRFGYFIRSLYAFLCHSRNSSPQLTPILKAPINLSTISALYPIHTTPATAIPQAKIQTRSQGMWTLIRPIIPDQTHQP